MLPKTPDNPSRSAIRVRPSSLGCVSPPVVVAPAAKVPSRPRPEPTSPATPAITRSSAPATVKLNRLPSVVTVDPGAMVSRPACKRSRTSPTVAAPLRSTSAVVDPTVSSTTPPFTPWPSTPPRSSRNTPSERAGFKSTWPSTRALTAPNASSPDSVIGSPNPLSLTKPSPDPR